MLIDGVTLLEGSRIQNAVIASGPSFPIGPAHPADIGEMFFKTNNIDGLGDIGLYIFDGSTWTHLIDSSALANVTTGATQINTGVTFPTDHTIVNNEAFFLTTLITGSPSYPPGLYVFNILLGTSGEWVLVPSYINTIDASLITSGTIDIARIPNFSWSKITSGTPTTLSGYGITDAATSTNLSTHAGDFDLHLTSSENIWIDAITATSAEVNFLSGTTSNVHTDLAGKLPLTGGELTGNLVIGTGVHISIADAPLLGTSAANKNYVDSYVAGLTWKQSVKAATTTNITLSAPQSIDGISVIANDRVLVKDQTITSTNGIYIVAAGAWTRSLDMDSTTPTNELNSAAVFVEQGSQANTGWTQINNITTLGTDPITFTQFNGASGISAGVGLSKSGNTLSVKLGAGITELPSGEVGVDVYSLGGLFNTVDGTNSSTLTNAQLSLTKVGTAGTYRSVTTDDYGRITAGTNPTTLSGYAISDAQELNSNLTSISALSTSTTGLIKLTSGVASLDTSTYLTANQTITLTGDVTGSGNGSFATTLATITQGAGSAFVKISLDTKGRVTGNTAVVQSDITGLLGSGSITNAMLVNTAVGNLSGTNTGDETNTTIKTKLGITTLSGTNTGDQTITLTGGVTGSGTGSFAATVVTNADLTGDITSVGNATTLTNAPVIAKVLTGFTSGAGTVSATDSILSAFQKLNGNDLLKAPIANPIFTGEITLPTGSSANAPLKFVSGSQSSTAVAGTMEYDGTGYYLTLGNGVRHTIAFTDGIPSSIAWSSVTGTPTTLSGYGITDGVVSNIAITGATHTKITYDAKGLVTGGVDLAASDIPGLSWAKITSGTPTTLSGYGITDAAPLAGYNSHIADQTLHLTSTQNTLLDGITVTYDKINYLSTVSSDVQVQVDAKLPLAGGSMTGSIIIPTGKVITLTDAPLVGTDAANKNYVDANIAGLTWKNSVRVATTTNITLSGTQTVDTVLLAAGNRILVKEQSNTTQNGIYVVSASTWTRSLDMDSTTPINELNSAAVFVEAGSQANTGWTQVNTVTSLGTDPIAFTQFNGASGITAGTGVIKSGNTLSVALGAGVAQLPTNEVGVDIYSTGGLILTLDGTTSSTNTAAQLALSPITQTTGSSFVKITLDTKGRVIGNTNVVQADITGLLGTGSISNTMLANTAVANLSGTNTGDQTITLMGGVTGSGTGSFAATVVTNANLTGEVTSVGNATTVTNAAVIAKVLTGFTSGAGIVSSTDNILGALQKINGNDLLKAPIANPTFTGTVTAPTFTSTVAIGTAPFTVASTTVVPNLNASTLSGIGAGQFVRQDTNTTMASNASITFAGTGKVTGLPAPTVTSDAANKAYVDLMSFAAAIIFG